MTLQGCISIQIDLTKKKVFRSNKVSSFDDRGKLFCKGDIMISLSQSK